jgi:hypothetical protein
MLSKIITTAAVMAALAVGSAAQASTNLITNSGFEQSSYASNSQFGSGFDGYGGQGVAGWTGGSGFQIYFVGPTATSVSAADAFQDTDGVYFYPSFNSQSPDGGNFVALDGDVVGQAAGSISQTLTGLQVGQTYVLTFDWAAGQLVYRSGPTTEQLQVSFGDQAQATNVVSVPSGGFQNWSTVTMNFTATDATQTLNFLSIGTPTGLPPMAVLDGVSLTAAPEPTSWAMMIVGLGGIGATIRHRRRLLAAA